MLFECNNILSNDEVHMLTSTSGFVSTGTTSDSNNTYSKDTIISKYLLKFDDIAIFLDKTSFRCLIKTVTNGGFIL